MQIEKSNCDGKESNDKIAQRLAILNRCLTANEVVESKPISTKIKQVIEVRKSDNSKQITHRLTVPTEIYLTNFRILLIMYLDNGHYNERSILFSSTRCLNILSPKINDTNKTSLLQYLTENDTIQQNIFLDYLQNEDQEIIKYFYEKNINTKPNIPFEIIVQKQLLEKDSRLQNFYQLIVQDKKILTEEQFWKNHEGYQHFLKCKERDEIKIKRDIIIQEIPLIDKEYNPDSVIEMSDDQDGSKFYFSYEQIQDLNSDIEQINQSSFQSYKQDTYFLGKIDGIIRMFELDQQLKEQDAKQVEDSKQDRDVIVTEDSHQFQYYTFELEENPQEQDNPNQKDYPQEEVKIDIQNKQTQEMKKEDFMAQLNMTPNLEEQTKFEEFIQNQQNIIFQSKQVMRNIKECVLKQLDTSKPEYQNLTFNYLKQLQKREDEAEEQTELEQTYPSQMSYSSKIEKANDIYEEKFYQLRELNRWLYKDQINYFHAKRDVIQQLKLEVQLIKNSIIEIINGLTEEERKESNYYQKIVNKQLKKRLQDLLDSFQFNQSSI